MNKRILIIVLIICLGGLGFIIWNFVGNDQSSGDYYKAEHIVDALENAGLTMEISMEDDSNDYFMGGISPVIYNLESSDNKLLIYVYPTFDQLDDPLDAPEIIQENSGLLFPVKTQNVILGIYRPINDYEVIDGESLTFAEISQIVYDTVFEDLNNGKTVIYQASNDSWTCQFTLSYYQNSLDDGEGEVYEDNYFDAEHVVIYTGENQDELGDFTAEFHANLGSSTYTVSGNTLDDNGYRLLGKAGGQEYFDLSVPITCNLTWAGNEDTLELVAVE